MFTGSSCRLTHRHLQCRVYKRLQPERTQNVGVIYWNCIEMRKDAVKVNYMSVNVDKLWTYLRWIDQTCHAWCSKFASLVNVANVANSISTSSKIFSEDLQLKPQHFSFSGHANVLMQFRAQVDLLLSKKKRTKPHNVTAHTGSHFGKAKSLMSLVQFGITTPPRPRHSNLEVMWMIIQFLLTLFPPT